MVFQITLTYNRATLLSRALYAFLKQDLEEKHGLIIFNTGEPLELGDFTIPENKEIILINQADTFGSVGEKYQEVLKYVPEYCTSVVFCDDDDLPMSHYLRQGVEGLDKLGFKPQYAMFHSENKLIRCENTHEGSIFLKWDFIKDIQFNKNSVKYHDSWIFPLLAQDGIRIGEGETSAWVYDWCTPQPVYKMSGKLDTPQNYQSSKAQSDFGNGILNPQPLNYHEINQLFKHLN